MKVVIKVLCLLPLFSLSVACSKDSVEKGVQSKSKTDYPDGCLPGVFSVSETKTVRFSQGNLQYSNMGTHRCADGTSKRGTWRFAEHQYDCVGIGNEKISSSYMGWIDLFGWGTSGYNGCSPYLYSGYDEDYGPADGNTLGSNVNYDWGVYNAISNGGDVVGKWRTLTKEEWEYLLNRRFNASSKCGYATVNKMKGVVLLPDSWTLPENCMFISGIENGETTNSYTADQWAAMEEAGALFLPAAGELDDFGVLDVGKCCNYWSSSALYDDAAWLMKDNVIRKVGNVWGYVHRCEHYSVRLVCE